LEAHLDSFERLAESIDQLMLEEDRNRELLLLLYVLGTMMVLFISPIAFSITSGPLRLCSWTTNLGMKDLDIFPETRPFPGT